MKGSFNVFLREVNKQATEQAVAIVCLEVLGVDYSVKMKKD